MKFKVGEHVVISNKGYIYTTFDAMAKRMELKSFKYGWNKNFGLNGSIGIIIKIVTEGESVICGVHLHSEKKDIMIGEEGLMLVGNSFDEDLFVV